MRVYMITFGVAFNDAQEPSEEWIRSHIRRTMIDGCEAETYSTMQITGRHVRVADPSWQSDARVERWQERAQGEIDRLVTDHTRQINRRHQ